MMRLPTGMYQPGYSVIHGISAAVKLVCLILLMAAIVATDSIPGYLAAITATAAIVYLAQVSAATAFASVRRLAWFFVLILLMNTCFYGADDAWFGWWIFTPSLRGLIRGANIVLRVVLILVLSNILTTTTAPLRLTDGMERLLSPLRIVRIPTEQIAMIMGLAAMLFIFCLFCEEQAEKWQEKRRRARIMELRIAKLRGGGMRERRESAGNHEEAGADTVTAVDDAG